ncbi:ammonium transporter [Chytriomyces hyalinus]|nr:ammonium transporter [Chytriomyces hyalinus]
MHSPAFFLSLLTLCASTLYAAPVVPTQSVTVDPIYDQPEAAPIDLGFSFPNLSARDGTSASIESVSAAATDALAKSLSIGKDQLQVSHAHTSTVSGIHHIHFVQVLKGIPVSNAVANVNITPDGQVLSVYQSFVTEKNATASFAASAAAPAEPITADVAVLKFAASKGLKTTDKLTVTKDGDKFIVKGASFAQQEIRASQKFYQKGSDLALCWDLSVDFGNKWQNAFVNAETGEVVAVNNWTSDFSDATYKVTPQFQQAPSGSLATIKSPWNLDASPNGWHVVGGQERNDLLGNNVAAASNPYGSDEQSDDQVINLPRPSSESLTFSYQWNEARGAMDPTNINTAVTNMFVAANTAHDLFYNYGFTENAANFQFDNMGKGGAENDGVIATSQDAFNTDPEARNNANFATPPDGQNGRMRMYVFDTARPSRDGALDNSIVYHEMAHGLSNRLTGGGSNPNCLPGDFSGGMGEGWSDIFAVVMTMPASSSRSSNIDMGAYVLGGRGIRSHPYSTSLSTNPLKYSTLGTSFILARDRSGRQFREVHNIGEIWCNMLYEVLWNMVDISGFIAPFDLIAGQASGKGNADFVSVVIQAMKNQPCNPTFIQARNAILDADKVMFKGKYSCAIWAGFAKRGMGVNAQNGGNFADNNDIPAGCSKDPQPNPKPSPKTTSKPQPSKPVPTQPGPKTTAPGPAPKPTTAPGPGGIDGQRCTSFGATQCENKATYLCAYYNSATLTWAKWYDGGC